MPEPTLSPDRADEMFAQLRRDVMGQVSPPPLTALIRRRRQRRTQRWGVVAAVGCVLAGVVLLWPSAPGKAPSVAGPVPASAFVTSGDLNMSLGGAFGRAVWHPAATLPPVLTWNGCAPSESAGDEQLLVRHRFGATSVASHITLTGETASADALTTQLNHEVRACVATHQQRTGFRLVAHNGFAVHAASGTAHVFGWTTLGKVRGATQWELLVVARSGRAVEVLTLRTHGNGSLSDSQWAGLARVALVRLATAN
ncbi:MAG: hypothetical protein ACRDP1_11920 [Nocardioidaceae bacterium]